MKRDFLSERAVKVRDFCRERIDGPVVGGEGEK